MEALSHTSRLLRFAICSLAVASTFTGAKPNFVSRSLIGPTSRRSLQPSKGVVVYKVDHLTRSLATLVEMGDSARLVYASNDVLAISRARLRVLVLQL
jgi:hypothetical protein